MAEKKQWHLVAYDIGSGRRLARVHRYLLSEGTPVQLSVFLVYATSSGIKKVIHRIDNLTNENEDDLAVYRTGAPRTLWRYGKGDHLPVWQLGRAHDPIYKQPGVDHQRVKTLVERATRWFRS